jgi:hypothetical protein
MYSDDMAETPMLEVRVYRRNVFVCRELCESEDDAAACIEAWEQEPGIRCEVDDLSLPLRGAEVYEVEPSDAAEYPNIIGNDVASAGPS